MQIAVRVQHHPSRAHLLPRLERALHPLPIEVIEHSSDPPNPWHGYRCCLTDVPDCTHLLVIQDDALPTPRFAHALEQVAHRWPDDLVVLFLSLLPRKFSRLSMRAINDGRPYIEVMTSGSEFCPVVANLWPRALIDEFMEWADTSPLVVGRGREHRSDDAVLGRFLTKTRRRAVITVPSLVQHDDQVPSVKGRMEHWGDRSRVALFLADGTEDWLRPA